MSANVQVWARRSTYTISDPNTEGTLSFIDALYFTILTVSSVGFGDLAPNTVASKVFAFFYDTGQPAPQLATFPLLGPLTSPRMQADLSSSDSPSA